MDRFAGVIKAGLIYFAFHFLLLFGWWLGRKPDGRLHLIVCDVGQGDAMLIITPKGKQMLIDTGPDASVLECLGDNLMPWDKTIDYLSISHTQSDHTTGLWFLREGYENRHIFLSKDSLNIILNIISAQDSTDSRTAGWPIIDILERGDHFTIDEVEFETIWPPNYWHADDENDNSLVFRLEYGNFSALLTGDATERVWNYLDLTDQLPPRTTVLKVPHHGAKNCCPEWLVESLRPKVAIISVGKNNRYRHPAPEAMKRLRSAGVITKRTDLKGNIEIQTNGTSFKTI